MRADNVVSIVDILDSAEFSYMNRGGHASSFSHRVRAAKRRLSWPCVDVRRATGFVAPAVAHHTWPDLSWSRSRALLRLARRLWSEPLDRDLVER